MDTKIELGKDNYDLTDEDREVYYFRVIGEDRKIHVSDLQTDFCKCGVKIIRKYVTEQDYSGTNMMYSCYECTF